MIEELDDLPEGVIGFTAHGELHSDDYKNVLLPAIEAAIERGEKIRILLLFPTFDGLSRGALWEDAKMGVDHLTSWKKIALVTDIDWMIHLTRLFGWMTPGDMKHFPLSQRDEAISWLAAD
jgi:hypothetical protein